MKRLFSQIAYESYLLFRKRVVLVLLIILALAAPVGSVVYKYVVSAGTIYGQEKKTAEQQIAYYTDLCRDAEEQMRQQKGADGDAYDTALYNLLNARTEVYYYQLLNEKGIEDNEHYYLNRVSETLGELQAKQYVADLCPESEIANEVGDAAFGETLGVYQVIFDTEDYAAYMKQNQKEIRDSADMTTAERDIALTVYSYRLAADLKGENTGAELDELLEEIRTYELALESGYDTTSENVPVPLSDTAIDTISENLKIVEYRLSKGQVNLSEQEALSEKNLPFVLTIMLVLILGIMVYLAGTSVAGEVTTGRLTLTLTQPVRRCEIFFARLIVYTLFGIVLAVVAYCWALLWTLMLFGKAGAASYFYLIGSGVRMIPGIWYGLMQVLLSFVWIWIAMLFAYLLSISWRNVIAACILPIGAYFYCAFYQQLSVAQLPYVIEKYLPGNNFAVADAVFGGTGTAGQPVWFLLLYLFLIAACFIYAAYDSFTRRDF